MNKLLLCLALTISGLTQAKKEKPFFKATRTAPVVCAIVGAYIYYMSPDNHPGGHPILIAEDRLVGAMWGAICGGSVGVFGGLTLDTYEKFLDVVEPCKVVEE